MLCCTFAADFLKMKKSKSSLLLKTALLLMAVVGLLSCSDTSCRDALQRAEALMEIDPHAARAVLDSLNLQSSIFNFQFSI